MAVIADLVPSGQDVAGYIGQTAHVHSALEESGAGAVALQDLENLGRGFAGAVVEGESDGAAVARPMPHRRCKQRRARRAHGVSEGGSSGGTGGKEANVGQTIVFCG